MTDIESRLLSRRRRNRQPSLGHMCPECGEPWALRARWQEYGFLVVCHHCTYVRPVAIGATRPVQQRAEKRRAR